MTFETSFLGLIDGLNICNLSMTALLSSTAYTSRLPRSRIVLLAATFLGSQALAYFLIGMGILGTLDILQELSEIPQHLVTRIAASIMLVLGGVVFVNALWPGTINIPSPPASLSKRIRNYLYSLGVVGVTLAGALLALHSIPCSCTGGVYFTFLSTISDSEFKVTELATYTVLYVLPSFTILAISLNKYTYTYVNIILNKGRSYRAALGILIALVAIVLLLLT